MSVRMIILLNMATFTLRMGAAGSSKICEVSNDYRLHLHVNQNGATRKLILQGENYFL
jgi:hypothetical protein